MACFASDNWAGAHPKIIEAIANADHGFLPAYGDDSLTQLVQDKFSEVFERRVAIDFTATGTGANALGVSAFTPPHGAIFCHEQAHILCWEHNAQAVFTGGAYTIAVGGANGKVAADYLQAAVACAQKQDIKPTTLSLTQQTELGTVYSLPELQALTATARRAGMKTHMDGARFANALVRLGCSPADMTWRAGVDVLSLGCNKNGGMIGDAVVVFDPTPELSETLRIRRARTGHAFPKMRYLAAQFLAYFKDGLWLDLARHANAQAQKLAARLTDLGFAPDYPVEGNQLFVPFPAAVAEKLRVHGHQFHPWHTNSSRLVTCFLTTDADIESFCRDVAAQTSRAA